jgi:dTMP kinase
MAKVIVIEGPDRVGKATQTNLLVYNLTKRAASVKLVEVPIESPVSYRIIYWMLSTGLTKKFPKFFQWMQWLNKQVFQWVTLKNLEKDYEYLVFDRWSLSSVIYGTAAGLSEDFLMNLYQRLRTPDYTIILDGQPHITGDGDVYEEDSQLQVNVRKLYADWASKNPDYCSLIDANRSAEDVSADIIKTLELNNVIVD